MRGSAGLRVPLALLFAWALFLSSCGSLIADYNLEAYKNATQLKAETLALVKKSNEPFSLHKTDVESLSTKVDVAYEFAAGIPKNQLSATQWEIMRDPDRHLYGGFVEFWKDRGTVSVAFRDEYASQLDQAFDYIICLEANKEKLSACKRAEGEGQQ